MFTLVDVETALPIVRAAMPPTPQYAWPLLCARVGAEVFVKHENHTPIGAFKLRGGIVYVKRLKCERSHIKGIVSATRGNHGQSLAFAGMVRAREKESRKLRIATSMAAQAGM